MHACLERSSVVGSDDAKDYYLQAANCYKLAENPNAAIKCYEKAIKCEENDADCAPHYKEAALCVKETDSETYCKYIQKAIDLYSLSGRTSQAAAMAKDCAQYLEE